MSKSAQLRQGIIETARELGVNPAHLATIISYETAGTFDPRQPGPRTQWGRHRGLIQWGEPQAREHGVDWNDPIGSQLGADGAIVRYMRNAGVKPGMGMLDLYSAVNAGRVGRYNASDANNGGAPGTVRDKVRAQMHGHARKAEQLLGGQFRVGQMSGIGQNEGPRPGTERIADVFSNRFGSAEDMHFAQRARNADADAGETGGEPSPSETGAAWAARHARDSISVAESAQQRLRDIQVIESTLDPNMPVYTY